MRCFFHFICHKVPPPAPWFVVLDHPNRKTFPISGSLHRPPRRSEDVRSEMFSWMARPPSRSEDCLTRASLLWHSSTTSLCCLFRCSEGSLDPPSPPLWRPNRRRFGRPTSTGCSNERDSRATGWWRATATYTTFNVPRTEEPAKARMGSGCWFEGGSGEC